MLFIQPQFIFMFLPGTLIGYVLLGRMYEANWPRLMWLAAASLFFYGYWDYHFLPIIGASILLNYAFGILISVHQGRNKKIAFVMAVTGNLLALGFFKYYDFFASNLNEVSGVHLPLVTVVLPLGISFFTFTQIAYLADIYAGKKSERSLTKYALFVTYFPHLIAGPILHHGEMIPQFSSRERGVTADKLATGLTIFGIGLFKKVVFADGFSMMADPVFQLAHTQPVSVAEAWTGALAYALQIYFDFSGYSDMAVGLSLMFGIMLPFNFDSPYKSHSISEFWRRWHITLSRFLRDYLYISLGGNRKGVNRRNINLFLTMVLGGIWHGAGWTFLIWGALHGAFLMVNHLWRAASERNAALGRYVLTSFHKWGSLLLTQIMVVIAWVFFRADSLAAAGNMMRSMFTFASAQVSLMTLLPQLLCIVVGYVFCLVMPNVQDIFAGRSVGLITYANKRRWSLPIPEWRSSASWAVGTAILLFVAIFLGSTAGDGSKFIYFQF